MELFKNKFDCCGCEACANVCSKGAISMQEDENGFRYPLIDNSKCIDCGLCRKVCAFQNIEETNCAKDVYVAASKDDEQILKSASGGIFAVIAKEVIEKGGIVCGSALMVKNNKVCVEHILIDSIKDISKLQGSKYVQSNINDCYKRIKQLLADGRIVLFSGTPCQCSGLKGFLRKPYDNLYIIDIICHGVPNQRFLNDYIEYKHPSKTEVSGFAFRDKSRGWGLTGRIDYEDGSSKLVPAGLSSYYSLFLDSQIYKDMMSAKELNREYRFNIKLPARDFTKSEALKEKLGNEYIFVQGVIDCYFYDENGEITLLDYKTDTVPKSILGNTEKENRFFVSKHSEQLSYYKKALEILTGRKVTKALIYSFDLARCIEISDNR